MLLGETARRGSPAISWSSMLGPKHPESVWSRKVVVLRSLRLKLPVDAAKDPAVGMGGPNGGSAVGPSGYGKCGVAPAVGFSRVATSGGCVRCQVVPPLPFLVCPVSSHPLIPECYCEAEPGFVFFVRGKVPRFIHLSRHLYCQHILVFLSDIAIHPHNSFKLHLLEPHRIHACHPMLCFIPS